jgi:hypothetical protein
VKLDQRIRYRMEGSALKGTMRAHCLGMETLLEIDSDESPERIQELVRMGEQTCFTMQALANPVPIETYVRLNGEDLLSGADDSPPTIAQADETRAD